MSFIRTEKLLPVLVAAAGEVAVHELPEIELTSEIADLGFDSLQTLELVACLEDRLRVRLPLELLAGVCTVGDLLAIVDRLQVQARAA